MDSKENQYNLLVKALLPSEIFNYFEITLVQLNKETIDVYLDELNVPPSKYEGQKLLSKGFHPAVDIQDFPIRERAVFLHVRRRKWQVESTGEIVSNTWDTVAQGTRYTKGFATFLKDVFGYLPNQQQKP
ncbi:MAG: transposase [Bacteroidota bacterium]|nr:transposase [Bacteroidota bacterium]